MSRRTNEKGFGSEEAKLFNDEWTRVTAMVREKLERYGWPTIRLTCCQPLVESTLPDTFKKDKDV